MSKLSKTLITAAILAASGIAAAATPLPPANYVGVENRDGLVAIPVCAKADLEAGTRFIWTEDASLRAALQAAAPKGCFERLGREGDMGYAQAGVALIKTGGNVYSSAVNGKPAGQALRALTAPKYLVKSPELTERSGIVTMAGYVAGGNMTIHAVQYADGTRDIVRRVGETTRLEAGTQVTVARTPLDADNYWLAISKAGL